MGEGMDEAIDWEGWQRAHGNCDKCGSHDVHDNDRQTRHFTFIDHVCHKCGNRWSDIDFES